MELVCLLNRHACSQQTHATKEPAMNLLKLLSILAVALVLGACGGGAASQSSAPNAGSCSIRTIRRCVIRRAGAGEKSPFAHARWFWCDRGVCGPAIAAA